MTEYELFQLLEACGYEPSDENLAILKEDDDLLEELLAEQAKQYRDTMKAEIFGESVEGALRYMLESCGYEPSDENLSVLREILREEDGLLIDKAANKSQGHFNQKAERRNQRVDNIGKTVTAPARGVVTGVKNIVGM